MESLRDRDQALVLRLIDLVDIRQKAFHVKIHLGKVDEIRAVAHPGSQSSRAGQPAGVASHDLQNGNGSVVVHMGVPLDLHAGGSDVSGCGAEARAVVGAVEVIVNGLGHADDAARIAHGLHVLGDFVACVHGVVAAVVEEIAHIILAENFENTAVVGVILAGISQLVAAGAQRGGRGVPQQLQLPGILLPHIVQPVLQDALDSVGRPQHPGDAVRVQGRADHPERAGIDDRSGASRLPDDAGSSQFTHESYLPDRSLVW